MRAMITSLALSALLCGPALAWSPNFFNNDLLPRNAPNTSVECGRGAGPGNETCALNVCCSESGRCGMTSEFCERGCQSNCGSNHQSCTTDNSIAGRTVGYYEGWSKWHSCQNWTPENLTVNGYTHINYAFAVFDPKTFAIAPADDTEAEVYARFTDLKTKNPGLQTWIAIGGWAFNDPGATANAFSDMVASAKGRSTFIKEIIGFMQTYAFDGVDIDWEYPAEANRGGKSADKENFAAFAKEVHAAFQATGHGFSVTLPAAYKHLKYIDVGSMADHVDFFNVMSYDMHGLWDETQGVGPYVLPHTNLTEIREVLDMLLKAKVAPEKIDLGLAFYGHTFTLKDAKCSTPNGVCEFSGAGHGGRCSKTEGVLNLQEILDMVSADKLNPILDKDAAVKYGTYDENQWVNYDDEETIGLKRDAANKYCLGGTMVWAMDQVNQNVTCGIPEAKRNKTRVLAASGSGTVASNCDQTQVPNNSSCEIVALANNVKCAQIMAWNPQIPDDWNNLKAAEPICIAPPGGWYKLAPPPPKPSTADAGSASSAAVTSGSASGSASGFGATQPGSPTNCKSFATPTPRDECNKLASANRIDLSQLYTLNPGLGPSCTALQAGVGYCIATDSSGGSATVAPSVNATATVGASASPSASTVNQSASASTAASSSGIPTASYSPLTVTGTLDATLDAPSGEASTAPSSASASMSSESAPASTNAASSVTPTTSTNAPSSAALTTTADRPSKTQDGIAADCVKFAPAVKDDGCEAFAKKNDISPDQLYAWNPILGEKGADCKKLWPDYYYCVGMASSTSVSSGASITASSGTLTARDVPSSVTTTVPTPSCTATVTAATAKPSATQIGIAADCIKFVQAGENDWCDAFAVKNGIAPEELYAWNQVLGWNGALCSNFRPGMFNCVCAATGGKPDSIFPQTERAPHRWTLLDSGPASSDAGMPNSAVAAGASATIA